MDDIVHDNDVLGWIKRPKGNSFMVNIIFLAIVVPGVSLLDSNLPQGYTIWKEKEFEEWFKELFKASISSPFNQQK